jgi:1-deoxy-D-xylulose-5-phosphate synthase
LQRGYDNIIHDIALQKLPVVMCIDRAGLNPSDGATHHGIFDVSFLSHIPNIKIYTPIFEDSLKRALAEAFLSNGPVAIRYPNACENSNIATAFSSPADTLDIKLDFCQEPDIIIITHGKIVSEALKAKEQLLSEKGIRVGIILLEFLKPYDKIAKAIAPYIQEKTKGIIFLEEEIQSGGMGMNLQASLRDISGFNINRSVIMAVNDSFVTERKAGENIYDSAKISAKYICKNAIDLYDR